MKKPLSQIIYESNMKAKQKMENTEQNMEKLSDDSYPMTEYSSNDSSN